MISLNHSHTPSVRQSGYGSITPRTHDLLWCFVAGWVLGGGGGREGVGDAWWVEELVADGHHLCPLIKAPFLADQSPFLASTYYVIAKSLALSLALSLSLPSPLILLSSLPHVESTEYK